MPSKRYAFAPGEAPRVEVSWRGKWKGTTVFLDGTPLGPPIDGAMEMLNGRQYPLADGSLLTVRLQVEAGQKLVLERNGHPMHFVFANSSNPLKFVTIGIAIVGALMCFAGLLPLIAPREDFGGITALTLATGLVLIATSMVTYKQRSVLAHTVGLVAFVAEAVYGFGVAQLNIDFVANTMGYRFMFVAFMAFGYLAILKAKRADALNRQVSAF